MKKFIKLTITAALAAMCLTSCGGGGYTADLSAADVYEGLSAAVETEELSQMRDAVIPDQYGSELDFVTDKVVYKCASQAAPDEIAVFKLEDAADAAEAEAVMNNRVDYQKEAFENYQPQEMYKFDNVVVKSYGNYTIMVIADDTSAVDDTMESLLAK